ncbi:MFS transporter [Paraburkholderia phenoliruptrix]|uniref:MFS transporter n=1 Tax=Paraburkholderia phenoliruptrix TaxID=252970 RepID=UPI002869CDF3|nr:MFS transporter [Paraburkholderia phenoliruptrix]WMY11763.1 MFS transporter [Paraburkholderia phenoliruptrix]
MTDLGKARLSSMGILLCNGLLYSTWGVYVPEIKHKFALSDGTLSIAMIVVAAGGIVTLARAGRWISQIGSGHAAVRSGMIMSLSAAFILLVPHFALLLPLLFVYGIATAANDVSVNAQGAFLEARSNRSMIGSLHGSFSVGGLIGATIASGWSMIGWDSRLNFLLLVAISCLTMSVASRCLWDDRQQVTDRDGREPTDESSSSSAIQRRLIAFGTLAFAGLVVEGAIYDWAAVYMRDVVKAPSVWIGLGYAAFAVGMAIGRVSGDRVRDQVPHPIVIVGSCALCLAGLSVTLTATSPHTVTVGFFVAGIGLSNVIPIMFSSAGKLSSGAGISAARGLAMTTRIAYVGLLVGPLAIGPMAEMVGLKIALLVLGIAVLAIASGWLILTWISGGTPWEIRALDQSTGLRI